MLHGRAGISCHTWKTSAREVSPKALKLMEDLMLEQRKGVRRREWQRETAKY